MRKLIFIFCLAIASLSYAQVPKGFTYQAIIRDNNGNPMSNKQVNIRISILDNDISGNTIYQETNAVSTNEFGLLNLIIGEGNPTIGDFNGISWKNSNYFKVELDADNTGNYDLLGINKLQSVPYAFFAEKSNKSTYADTAFYVNNVIGDKTIKLEFGPSGGISTNSSTGYIINDLSKCLLNFNKLDYKNVASIYFCVLAKSGNPSNSFEVELYDIKTNHVISNSTITGNNSDFQVLKSANLFDELPDSDSNLSVRVKSSDGINYVTFEKAYIVINKVQTQISAVDISETK